MDEVKCLDTVVLIYRHSLWAIMVLSENLFDIIAWGKCEAPYTKKPI